MSWRGEPGPPPPGGWGRGETIALLVFLAVLTAVCVLAERSGQLTP